MIRSIPDLYPLDAISNPPPHLWQPKVPADIAWCPLSKMPLVGSYCPHLLYLHTSTVSFSIRVWFFQSVSLCCSWSDHHHHQHPIVTSFSFRIKAKVLSVALQPYIIWTFFPFWPHLLPLPFLPIPSQPLTPVLVCEYIRHPPDLGFCTSFSISRTLFAQLVSMYFLSKVHTSCQLKITSCSSVPFSEVNRKLVRYSSIRILFRNMKEIKPRRTS